MRLQGTSIIQHVLDQGLSFCVFDFHGNGQSNGKYVTFGWTETLDLDAVLTMLLSNLKVKSVILYGRSMGAATAIFYLSEKFREIIYNFFRNKCGIHNLGFIDQQYIKGCILDSPIGDMRVNVRNFVQSKAPKVPDILIDMALAVIDSSVLEKTGIMLTDIKPACYLDGMNIPTMILCGEKDEMIKMCDIQDMFVKFNTKVKSLKVLRGSHSSDRNVSTYKQICKFCKVVFKNSQSYERPAARKALAPVYDIGVNNTQGVMRDSIALEGTTVFTRDFQSQNRTIQINLPSKNTELNSILTDPSQYQPNFDTLDQMNMSDISTVLRNARIDKEQLKDIDSVSLSALDFDFQKDGNNSESRRLKFSNNHLNPNHLSVNNKEIRRVGKSPIITLGGKQIIQDQYNRQHTQNGSRFKSQDKLSKPAPGGYNQNTTYLRENSVNISQKKTNTGNILQNPPSLGKKNLILNQNKPRVLPQSSSNSLVNEQRFKGQEVYKLDGNNEKRFESASHYHHGKGQGMGNGIGQGLGEEIGVYQKAMNQNYTGKKLKFSIDDFDDFNDEDDFNF